MMKATVSSPPAAGARSASWPAAGAVTVTDMTQSSVEIDSRAFKDELIASPETAVDGAL